jgi:hypothetical protein
LEPSWQSSGSRRLFFREQKGSAMARRSIGDRAVEFRCSRCGLPIDPSYRECVHCGSPTSVGTVSWLWAPDSPRGRQVRYYVPAGESEIGLIYAQRAGSWLEMAADGTLHCSPGTIPQQRMARLQGVSRRKAERQMRRRRAAWSRDPENRRRDTHDRGPGEQTAFRSVVGWLRTWVGRIVKELLYWLPWWW